MVASVRMALRLAVVSLARGFGLRRGKGIHTISRGFLLALSLFVASAAFGQLIPDRGSLVRKKGEAGKEKEIGAWSLDSPTVAVTNGVRYL